MTRILLFLFVFSSTALIAQPVNQTDAKGQKQGVWKKTYEGSQQLRYEGQFKNNLPVGVFTYYAKSGKITTKLQHREDGTSFAQNFYETGKLSSEGKYKGQKKDSTWLFYDEQTRLLSSEDYKDDLRNGMVRVFYQSGKVSREQSYLNGLPNGKAISYYENGMPQTEDNYANNMLNGESKIFGPKGNLTQKGHYQNNVRDGEWSTYNDDNSLRSTIAYKDNQPGKLVMVNGVFDEFFNNELLKARYTYKNGKLDGPFVEYYDGGTWELVEKVDPRSEEKETYRIEKNHFVKRKGAYQNGLLQGRLEEYSANGTLNNVVNYINGKAQ